MASVSFQGVHLQQVTKLYGRHRALGGVSLRLEPGKLCALLGPNGAGKSTLVGILSTLVRPSQGSVRFELAGGAVADEAAIRQGIGLLAHESLIYGELSARENLRFFGTLYDVPALAERSVALLGEVGLDPGAWDRPARTYSRGMTQRLALARALLHDPSLLLLDEPFTGLDRQGIDALTALLARVKAQGRVVFVVSHELEALGGLCDHLAILRRGRLAHEERREAAFSADELRALVLRHAD